MGKRKHSRVFGGVGFTFLLVVLLVGMAVPVLAHYPVIAADYVCQPDGSYLVSGYAGPWDGGGVARRTNPSIEVHRGSYDGPLVATGAFVAVDGQVVGFDWTDPMVFPGGVAQDVTYVVIATADWGGNDPTPPRAPNNLHPDQTVTVSLSGTCVSEEIPGEIITKKVTNSPSEVEFGFTASWLEVGFTLANGQTNSSGPLPPGTYEVAELVPGGWTLTSAVCDNQSNPAQVSLQAGETVTCTFTNTQDGPTPSPSSSSPATGAIGDLVWLDSNSDGHQGDFEVGVGGVTVNLLNSSGLIAATTVTDTGGKYLFTGLVAGTYEVQFIVPAGFEVSPLQAAGTALDSDAGLAGRTGLITLAAGQTDLTWDAGIYEGMSRVEVLPQVITTTTVTTAAQTTETLPFTGTYGGGLGGIGVALIALGGLMVLVLRRRDERTES